MEGHLQDRDRVGVQDAVLLEDYMNEDAFVDNLRKRYKADIIYTYIGPVLVSVNPYKQIDIYGPKDVKGYKKKHFFEVPPHIFAVTDTSFRTLKEENRDQCILISGESGSGKTEASKKVLQYIAEVTEQKGHVETVKDKLLHSNPILEAFGNAKTNRNDNSSRFGKYMDIQFNFEGNPIGGNIINYLLEKSRVVHQTFGERNFHIFYQLLEGATSDELDELLLTRDISKYYYLSHERRSNTNEINDMHKFHEVKEALRKLEFSEKEQKDIFKIISAILHLGNVGFTENEEGVDVHAEKQEFVRLASELLSCDKHKLELALKQRTIETNQDVVVSPLNREVAIYARDALAKAIYDRLFTWLVERINSSFKLNNSRKTTVMGILDIYGFEIFEKNSFEQFCINYCNEKLQQLFIDLTLKSEQNEYEKEGIRWQFIEYFDNKIICELIEAKHMGFMAFLDEECLRPGDPDDSTLLFKLNTKLSHHAHYISHQKADNKLKKIMGRDEFRILHYASPVTYNIKSFMEKNNDLLFRDLREVMVNSRNSIIQSIFLKSEQQNKKRPESAITQFKLSVNNLMCILRDKEPSYIRCIKPNDYQKSGQFDTELIKHQVKYLGLMENLRVRRAGFAYRRDYGRFLERYKPLSQETWPNYTGSPRDGVEILVRSLGYGSDEYQMGKTKIFIKYPKTLFHTEDSLQLKKHDIATIIQSKWKGILQRRKYLAMREAAIVIQKYTRRYVAKRAAERRRRAAFVIRRFIKGFITRNEAPTEENKAFLNISKVQWLIRLSKSLPKSILYRVWPSCPHVCRDASKLLEKYYGAHMSRVYRMKLTPEKKQQLEMKVLAEKIFKGKKKTYDPSIPKWFRSDRFPEKYLALKEAFKAQYRIDGEFYSTSVVKYDRHGYKPRQRLVIFTKHHMYVLECKSSASQKHCLPLDKLKFIITSENDKLLLVQIPEELLNKDKGDLILEVPHLIEAMTFIINTLKNPEILQIMDKDHIEHNMKGKHGTIDIQHGSPPKMLKDKTGHLLVVS